MPDAYWVDPVQEMAALTAARRRRDSYNRLANTLTAQDADYASGLLRRHPNMSAGLTQALTLALQQAPTPDEVVDRLADQDDGGWFDRVRDIGGDVIGDVVGHVTGGIGNAAQDLYERGIKPVIRGTFVLADGLAQEVVQRPLTSVLAAAQGEAGMADAYRDYGDSALRNLIQGDLDEDAEGGVLGKGFFAAGQAGAEARNERVLQINGRKADIGQAFAGATVGFFADPGDRAYDAVAGISGFAVDVGLDPLAWLTGGTSKGATLAGKIGASAGTQAAIRGGAMGAVRARGALKAGDAADILRRYGDDAVEAPTQVSRSRQVTRIRREYPTADAGELRRARGDLAPVHDPADLTDALFREVGLDDAEYFLPGTFDSSERVIYFSNTRNLARGQGRNQGVVFEFDTKGLRDMQTRVELRKPGSDLVYDAGEAELTLLTSPAKMSDAVRSITVHSGAKGTKGATVAFQRRLQKLVDEEGWLKVDVDDGVRYIKPVDIEEVDEITEILHAAGAINGARRNTVLVDKASDFFRSKDLLSRLAEADAYDIAKGWRQSMANRLDGDLVRRLGDATTEEEVAEILLGAVAHGDITQGNALLRGSGRFMKKHRLTNMPGLRAFGHNGKLAGIAPNGVVSAGSADDIWESAEKLDSLLRQANMDEGFRRGIYNRTLNLGEGDFGGLFDITTDALDEIGKKLGDAGPLASLKNVAQKYSEELEAFRKYGVESWGGAIDVPYANRKFVQNFDGEMIETIIPTPQITSELNSLALHLPDVTDIRRAATKTALLRKVYTSKGWELGADAARAVTRDLFKPLAILRPAYVVRIGAEEQARLAAAGYDSVFNHPFRWLMANVTNRDELRTLTGDNLVDRARALDVITKDAHGRFADSLGSRSRVFGVTSVKLDDAGNLANDAYRGWRGELGQLASAQEARKMAELRGNLTEFKAWAQTEGLESITRLSRVNDEAASLLNFGDDFDQWAQGLSRRVQMKTGGIADEATGMISGGWDEDLVQRIVDQNIPLPGLKRATNEDAAFHSFLSAKARQGIHPGKVKIEHIEDARIKAMDKAVDWLFDHITGKPTSRLARFPTMRQAMIRRGGELMDGLADDVLRRDALQAFSKNLNLTDAEFATLAQRAQDAAGKRGLIDNLNDFDEIIVARSAQDAKDLLFDVTRRGAGQDAMVAVLPFLDAWKEVTLNWTRLLKDNPAFFIRAQAGYKELRDQGTFYTNEYGQEVFRYWGGGALATFVDEMNQRGGGLHNLPMAAAETVGRVVTGDTPEFSVSPEAPVSGLNMIATGVGPGFGPIVQWAATSFAGPDTRKLREFIAPFGTGANDDPEDLLNFGGLVGSLAPAWMRKATNAIGEGTIDERQWNSMVGDAMNALVSSGEYDPARDADRLLEDAERYAHYQLLFRASAQFLGPTGPNMAGQVELDEDPREHEDWDPENDPSGRMFYLGVMRADYFRLVETYGFDGAAEKFFDMYGVEPFYMAQGKTTSQGRELPVDQAGDDWMQANSDVADDYQLVAGFFAPTSDGAKFDFSVYSDQLARGDRKSLTPKEQQALANKARARSIWSRVQAQAELLPPNLRDSMLYNAKGQLDALHPGWQADVIVQPAARDKIAELQRAADDPRLDDNPLTQPLREYMALRSSLLARVRMRTGSPNATLTRKDATLERQQLMAAGVRLAQRSPAFMGAWSGLLKNELTEG